MGNVAINGFGRIGRSILRIIVENDSDVNIVAINDLGNYENLAYLLKHDSVMGILESDVRVEPSTVRVPRLPATLRVVNDALAATIESAFVASWLPGKIVAASLPV